MGPVTLVVVDLQNLPNTLSSAIKSGLTVLTKRISRSYIRNVFSINQNIDRKLLQADGQ